MWGLNTVGAPTVTIASRGGQSIDRPTAAGPRGVCLGQRHHDFPHISGKEEKDTNIHVLLDSVPRGSKRGVIYATCVAACKAGSALLPTFVHSQGIAWTVR